MLVNSVERHESVLSQVVHGCRQLVSWDVRLSPATSATLVLSCHHSVGNSRETADVKSEEGGDDVKSSCPLWPGRHTCYNGRYKETRTREGGQISESRSQYGLKSATRLHEAGIASNRESAMSRWIRSRGLGNVGMDHLLSMEKEIDKNKSMCNLINLNLVFIS